MTDLDADAARDRLLTAHRETVDATLDCADAVSAAFETTVDGDPATENSREMRANLRAAMERAGLLNALAELLPDVVDAAGATMGAPPVAAPPYVTVTSTGPVLRATVGEERLVVRIEAFAVEDGLFIRRTPSLASVVSVAVK
ncbi:hypothetical protein JCM17823_28030 [Halorubrum gandharaense]